MIENSYAYDPSVGIVGAVVMMVICFGFLLCILDIILSKTKSKQYREKIADMYVVGILKKFAEKDKVDISDELKAFNKDVLMTKRERKKEFENLDDTIEHHIQEKVDAHTEKELQKIADGLIIE